MGKITKNPFSFGAIVKDDDYCPRIEDEAKIEELIVSGQKVAIMGERRMGKTSLALHILEEKMDRSYVHVDFMGVRDEREAASRILNGVANAKRQFFKFEAILRSLGHLKPIATIDEDGRPTFTFSVQQSEVDESINAAFELLKQLSAKKIVVFFDEFQDLLKIDDSDRLFGVLRAKIQTFSRVPFIFAGSYRSQMGRIFKDPSNPFYNAATVIEIGTIQKEEFHLFTLQKMNDKKIKVSKKIFDRIYNMVYGISGDVQRFFRMAYLLAPRGSVLTQETCETILREMFSYEKTTFEEILTGSILSNLQRDVLLQLAHDNTNPYAKDFMIKIGTTSSSGLTRALNALEKKNFIYRYRDEYRFYNPFLKEWIKSYKKTS